MSALRSTPLDSSVSGPDIHSGGDTNLFTSGSAPRGTAMLDGAEPPEAATFDRSPRWSRDPAMLPDAC